MSDRRVPRFDDDYSAELPTWPARETNAPRPSINDEPSPGAGLQAEALLAGTGTGTLAGREGRREGEAASACLPTDLNQTADPCSSSRGAPFTAGEVSPHASPAGLFSEACELLLGLIATHDGVSRAGAIERAVAFYADRIGIAALARPMPCGGGYPTPALRADSRVPAASGSDPASSPDDRATGTIDGSGSEPREGEGGRGGAPP